MSKNIAVNALFLIPGKVGGTEIFLRNQIAQLAKDQSHRYFLFTNPENHALFRDLPPNFKTIRAPVRCSSRLLRNAWEQLVLPLQCLYFRIDLLHSPGYTGPLFAPCVTLTTIFDLNYWFHPEDFSRLQLFVYRALIPLVARTSDHILVHSQRTRDEFATVLKVDSKKISVIYGAYHQRLLARYPRAETDQVLGKHNVHAPYILANAVSHPHKNLPALVEAYAQLRKAGKLNCPLVLLGFPGRDQDRLVAFIAENRLEKDVVFTGWVSQEEIPYFYQGALLFVFPSLYEGFGLPLVEAMASGVPLLASTASCVPEIVGDGGLLVDTTKPDLIAGAIDRILNDGQLAGDLAARGGKRARDFSWDKFGGELTALYDRLLA